MSEKPSSFSVLGRIHQSRRGTDDEPLSDSHLGSNELLKNAYPVHPGEILTQEVFPEKNITIDRLKQQSVIKDVVIDGILEGKLPVTYTFTQEIETLSGYPADLLLRLQRNYDEAEKTRKPQP